MCFDPHDHPPIRALAGGAYVHRRFELRSTDGTPLSAFEARTAAVPSRAAMLILRDARGLHPYYEELALRCAEAGDRRPRRSTTSRETAGIDERADDFPLMEHLAQTRRVLLQTDITAAASWLDEAAPGRALFAMGFCFGGRLAFLTATTVPAQLTGVIGFYGVRAARPASATLRPRRSWWARCMAPCWASSEAPDASIPPESITEFEGALAGAGVPHELHAYPGAPHSFFDRKALEFAAESADAWDRVLGFVAAHAPSELRAVGAGDHQRAVAWAGPHDDHVVAVDGEARRRSAGRSPARAVRCPRAITRQKAGRHDG